MQLNIRAYKAIKLFFLNLQMYSQHIRSNISDLNYL